VLIPIPEHGEGGGGGEEGTFEDLGEGNLSLPSFGNHEVLASSVKGLVFFFNTCHKKKNAMTIFLLKFKRVATKDVFLEYE